MVMQHVEETVESAGGLRLYYQAWRPPQEPRAVVAIIHGIGEHSGRFRNLVNYLTARGHAVYALDLRGHGRSPGQRGHLLSWSEYREDVRAFLAKVSAREPGRPLFAYGHSMGGLITLDYVLRHPEGLSGTIISGPPFESVGVATPLLVLSARVLSLIWPVFALEVPLEPEALCRDPAVVSHYLKDPLVHRKASARWAVEAIEANVWVKDHAAELRLPLLLLHGEEDRINTAAGSRQFFESVSFPDKKLHLVPGGYHEPHNDPGYEQVLQQVEEFLLSHVPVRAPSWDTRSTA
ncbi:alpha/beta hydrolase [Archangium lansingense]|uniref:Lysophospholipase n=1 Tax=Archangium lansingense TaxID=2995310 RepID=A0ABT4A2S9_9BACT|nr:alpha/beta hydrolase [Archangium lansinium]MCY1075957.1 lysophospholipase [Archangium lansinium]